MKALMIPVFAIGLCIGAVVGSVLQVEHSKDVVYRGCVTENFFVLDKADEHGIGGRVIMCSGHTSEEMLNDWNESTGEEAEPLAAPLHGVMEV